MTLRVLPSDHDVELGSISAFEPDKPKLFYAGREPTILKRFGTEQTNLLQISQNNPRRNLQLRYVREIAKVEEVPE
jgi:molecular chaperone HtpG